MLARHARHVLQGFFPASTASAWEANSSILLGFRYEAHLQSGLWKCGRILLATKGPNSLSAWPVVPNRGNRLLESIYLSFLSFCSITKLDAGALRHPAPFNFNLGRMLFGSLRRQLG